MIASHRTPAMLLMVIGGSIVVAAVTLPIFLYHELFAGFLMIVIVAVAIGLPLLTAGACVYARGKGYSAWLGAAALSIVGLFVLMVLPDRFHGEENKTSRRKSRRLIYWAASPFLVLAAIWLASLLNAFFAWGSFCTDCGAQQSSRAIFWIPLHHVKATKLSACLESLGYKPNHKHEWLFSAGGGGSIQCAIGDGRYLLNVVDSAEVVAFVERARKHLPDEEFDSYVRRIFSEPNTVETRLLISCGDPSEDFSTALDEWKRFIAPPDEGDSADTDSSCTPDKSLLSDELSWKPQSLKLPTDSWPEVPLR